MNLPEYRRVQREAHQRFRDVVMDAHEILAKDLMAADEQFFEDQDQAVEVGEYAVKRRAL